MCRSAVYVVFAILVAHYAAGYEPETSKPINGTLVPFTPSQQAAFRRSLVEPTVSINATPNVTGRQPLLRGSPELLARHLGMNAVMSSFLYSLTMVPLFLIITKLFTPSPHGFYGYGYGRRKRALVNESHFYRHLPLMNREETRRFLSLFETTLRSRKIYNEECKKYYSCKVFHSAVRSGTFPTLSDFEIALLNVFGIVSERYDHKLDLIPAVKMYYEIASNAFKGISCAHKYPCPTDQSGNRHKGASISAKRSATQLNGTKSSTTSRQHRPIKALS